MAVGEQHAATACSRVLPGDTSGRNSCTDSATHGPSLTRHRGRGQANFERASPPRLGILALAAGSRRRGYRSTGRVVPSAVAGRPRTCAHVDQGHATNVPLASRASRFPQIAPPTASVPRSPAVCGVRTASRSGNLPRARNGTLGSPRISVAVSEPGCLFDPIVQRLP